MTVTLLFCIADEAKSAVSRILNSPDSLFALVESQECPSDRTGLKTKLADNEDFKTAFAGVLVEDCQKWLLKHQDTAMFIEPNIIGIADARTAKDGTVLISRYHEPEGFDCPPYGVLPPNQESFWDWRVRPEQAPRVGGDLCYSELDMFPYYFSRREEFTDKNGVFDTDKVDQAARGNTSTAER